MSTKSTNSIDDKEIIDRFLEFAEKSRQRFNDEIKDFRDTRAFASGDQDVATSLGKGRMSSRANIIPRVVAAVVNPVRATPYDVSFQLSSDDGNPELSQTLNQWKTDVFDRSNSKEIFCRAMKESTTYGLGGFYVTTVRDEFTEDVHCEIDIIDDPTMIVRDPFSRDDSGADSEKTAVIAERELRRKGNVLKIFRLPEKKGIENEEPQVPPGRIFFVESEKIENCKDGRSSG